MKIIVTHKACDLDAIASTWLIKRFLEGWENSEHRFVPAGMKLQGKYIKEGDVIERISEADGAEEADVIHTDTGLGPLDHHQINDDDVCATSRAFEYVLENNESLRNDANKVEALKRIVEYAIDDDHFQQVFYENPDSSVHDFNIVSLISGIKLLYPKDDQTTLNFGMEILDSIYHYIENKVWAEREIEEKGIVFQTKWGKAIAVETLTDTVMKLSQAMGYVLAVRKDPSAGSVRIKVRPLRRLKKIYPEGVFESIDIDLTPVYEKLKQMDPEATWYLHVSKRMLLNGSSKNTEMKGSKLTLSEVVEVIQNI